MSETYRFVIQGALYLFVYETVGDKGWKEQRNSFRVSAVLQTVDEVSVCFT